MYILYALYESYSIGHECNKGGAAHRHVIICPMLIVNKYHEGHVKRTLKIQSYEHSFSAAEMDTTRTPCEVLQCNRTTYTICYTDMHNVARKCNYASFRSISLSACGRVISLLAHFSVKHACVVLSILGGCCAVENCIIVYNRKCRWDILATEMIPTSMHLTQTIEAMCTCPARLETRFKESSAY